MTHAIYIYFIINAFLAGMMHKDLDNLNYTFAWFFFGAMFPLYLAWNWLDRQLEITTLFVLYFTNWFKTGVSEAGIALLRRSYTTENRYKRWVLRQLDKKYNYGITSEDTK